VRRRVRKEASRIVADKDRNTVFRHFSARSKPKRTIVATTGTKHDDVNNLIFFHQRQLLSTIIMTINYATLRDWLCTSVPLLYECSLFLTTLVRRSTGVFSACSFVLPRPSCSTVFVAPGRHPTDIYRSVHLSRLLDSELVQTSAKAL
jgi:hypothetical protein